MQVAEPDCYSGDGRSYEGKVNQTMEGVECLPWDDERSEYRELGSNNYCRNPGPPGYEEEGPWCYTHHQHIVWGYCGVTRCQDGEGMFIIALSQPRLNSDVQEMDHHPYHIILFCLLNLNHHLHQRYQVKISFLLSWAPNQSKF